MREDAAVPMSFEVGTGLTLASSRARVRPTRLRSKDVSAARETDVHRSSWQPVGVILE